ncbi:MAG: TIM barrel protein [Lentisphaerae bacterium]|nr:TIM barrel protein [Lentisphaerota bacterium]
MILRRDPPLHLTYCLNVHPGESWDANLRAIRTHALRVRDLVGAPGPFGLGLRLSRAAVEELHGPAHTEQFRAFLAEHDLYVFTVNGFPYGAFHGAAVKQRVYAPDWGAPERLEYTTLLAETMAALLPEGVPGSISTVPGSYGAWARGAEEADRIVRNLAECARRLRRIEAQTGRRVMLALEPEPDCLFETTAGTVAFFNGTLARHPAMREQGEAWRRHVGVCLDACHLSVQFEDPAASLLELTRGGIAVPKVHVSAALRAGTGAETARALRPFAEGVYLHQTRLRGADGTVRRWTDLTAEALDAVAREQDGEARVHVHVPLYFREAGALRSTSEDLSAGFFEAVRDAAVPHLEIETYTFNVLPPPLGGRPVEESIAGEYRWVLERARAAK